MRNKSNTMTFLDWILLIAVLVVVAINCFFIWYEECVTEYVDREPEQEQEEVNVQYIKEQMNEEQIKLTIKKINK